LKTYSKTNFFKHTFCEFKQVNNFEFPTDINYKSKSESIYFYTTEGVYRKSNHWGRVANCRWKINANQNYKNQEVIIGFAKWADFYPINSTERIFFIEVNFKEKTAKIQPKQKYSTNYLFNYSEAQRRVKQITHLLNEDRWAIYFNDDIEILRNKVISDYINSSRTLQEIKLSHK
jgi:hypothetical protein